MTDIQAWLDQDPQRCSWCPEPAYGHAVHSDGKLHPSCGRINHGNAWAPRAWDRLPQALNALQAVLDLHKPIQWWRTSPGSKEPQPVRPSDICEYCRGNYPCPTIRAIQDAIGDPQ